MTFTGTNDTTVATDSSLVTESKKEVIGTVSFTTTIGEVSRAMTDLNPSATQEKILEALLATNKTNVVNKLQEPVSNSINEEEISRGMTLNPSATREEVIKALSKTNVVNKVQKRGIKRAVSNSTDKDAECLDKVMSRSGACYEYFLKNEDIDVIKFMINHKTYIRKATTFIKCIQACGTKLSMLKILFEEIPCNLTFDRLLNEIDNRIYYDDNIVLLKYLIENGLITNINKYLPQFCRSYNDFNQEDIKYLISKGGDINVNNDICLESACANNNIKNMKLLLENGAKFNTRTITLILKDNDIEMYQLMVNNGVKVVNDGTYYINPTILEYMKNQEEQDKSMYYGVESTNKLDIKFPELLELEKNGKYYYVYKFTKTDDKFILDKEEIRKEIMKHLTKLFSLDTACSFYF